MKLRILIFLFVLPLITKGQEELKWNFAIRPGTEQWNHLKTEKERINAMQIPDDILDRMSSKEFVDACINFPLFGYYSAFNTPQQGFDIMFSRFNLFKKICEKDSIGQYLLKIYEDAKVGGWQDMENRFDNEYWTLKLNYLEYLIGQKEVISKLNSKERTDFLLAAKTKLNQKRNSESFNSISGISPSLLIMTRILESNNTFSKQKDVEKFLKSGSISDTKIVDIILNSTELYLNQ